MDNTVQSMVTSEADEKAETVEDSKYEKLSYLGQGAFGKVYLVKEIETEEILVMKQISTFGKNQQEVEQLFLESSILKQLDHPNIIAFKEVIFNSKSKFKIVMEYAEGGDLQKFIKGRKQQLLPENIILDLFSQICNAILYIQSKKIMHRDLKCENIFLTKDNHIKLGDFGIAKVLKQTMDKANTFVGTPYYLSPEILENRPYSFESDIWALGVILYELTTLTKPFDAESLHLLALKIVRGKFKAIDKGNYSQNLKNLIAQMLQVQPSKRPQLESIIQITLTTLMQNKETKDKYIQIQNKNIKNVQIQNDCKQKQKIQADQKYLQVKAAEQKKKLSDQQIKMKKEEETAQKKRERDEERRKMVEDLQKRKKEMIEKDKEPIDLQALQVIQQKSDQQWTKKKTPAPSKYKTRDIPVIIFLPKMNQEAQIYVQGNPQEKYNDQQNEKQNDKQNDKQNEKMKEQENNEIFNELSEYPQSESIRCLNYEEEKSLQYMITDHSKLEELRLLLEEWLGPDNFLQAYRIISEKFDEVDLDVIEENYAKNNYEELLPFLDEELRVKYLSYLFTLIILEQKTNEQ